ncbi:MAG TPA: cyclic 2,3-diphosphoglycerate synthase [Micromonosporaceae bacterium]|nr:cyclic 2,3-diphosphoglycerate synthase [Micromonosporaceae bacterium]
MRRIVIMGAGGRDFHDFNTVFREDTSARVIAFTAAQIPGIAGRTYPPSLAGPQYPQGIPILAEEDLPKLIADEDVDEVVLAYSDLSHEEVMHKASLVLSCGADFRLIGPKASSLASTKPVIAVCAVRTGCGKSQTSRRVGQILLDAGLAVAQVRHPMPYGDLERMRVQRFASLEEIDASNPTIEEREEYEAPVRMGVVMYAGVDYEEILRLAEPQADVVIWDGGNNDFPFYTPDLMITVVDPLRPGHELAYYPGETNLRMADVVVVNKVDSAEPAAVEQVLANVKAANPQATIVMAASPPQLEPGPSLAGKRVLVIEDGPTATHGGMPFGAGTVAARQAGAAEVVDPRPYAVGSIADTYAAYPAIGAVLPAMGYGDRQLAELAETVRAADCDAVIVGTPMDLGRLVDLGHPVRRVTYDLQEVGSPTLAEVFAPHLAAWRTRGKPD